MHDRELRVATAASDRIALAADGGQLLSWFAGGRERLFLSPLAATAPGQAIRGGVPVIFPQFNAYGPGPRHGFARVQRWRPLDAGRDDELAAELDDSPASLALWPHPFRLQVRARLGAARVDVELAVANPGPAPFAFTAALHTYLAVDDVADAALHGLEGRAYTDAADAGAGRVHDATPLRFAGEVDRIYFDCADELRLSTAAGSVRIGARGFTDTVVWNPGAALAARLPDLGAAQHSRFVCVEAAIIGRPVTLAPGATWRGTQSLALA